MARRFFGVSPLRLAFGLLVLTVIVGGLFWLDRRDEDDPDTGALDGRSPELGEPAPLFALRDTGGDVVELADFEGQPVWLNFWATWCGPCREELPDIQALSDEYGDEVVVLTINQGQSEGAATDFWEELNLALPILLDSDEEVSDQYNLIGLPNNFFIDADGVIRAVEYGFLNEEEMRENLAELGVG